MVRKTTPSESPPNLGENFSAQIFFVSLLVFFFTITADAEIRFTENASQRHLDFVQTNGSPEKEYIVEAKGAGVAVADVNGDGHDDIYFVNGASLDGDVLSDAPKNRLYLNNGDATFRDATDESGLGDTGFGTGAYFADVNNDGLLDCYLTNYGPNQLYINKGGAKFEKVENAGGAQNKGWSTGAAFADINEDGFLDLYVGQYAEFSKEIADRKGKLAPYHGTMSFIGPSSYQPAADNLFINNGDGTFRDETKARGINAMATGRAFTVHFTDLDNDGDLDIYVANDTTYNLLYENTGQGMFDDISLIAGVGLSENGKEQGGMGVAVCDVDGDQNLDIAVANYQSEYNILYRNLGGFQFRDETYLSGIGKGTDPLVSFGMLLEDFDNDAWPDMLVTTGHVYPVADKLEILHGYAQRPLLLRNTGGIFADVTDQAGDVAKIKGVSRGSAVGDFDRDGDLDVVVNNLDGKPFFLENQSQTGHWIQIAVQDGKGMPAYGARVTVITGERTQIKELYSSASFLSQNSATLHFGLGEAETVDKIEVKSPLFTATFENVKANQRKVVRPTFVKGP